MSFGFVIFTVVLIAGCNADNVKSIVQSNEEFTVKTYKELVKTSGSENFIFSGLSAEIILSLLTNGAKGETQTQLLNGLSLPDNLETTNKGYKDLLSHLNVNTEILKLLSANKIYPAEGFTISKNFNDTAINTYEAGVQNLNYENVEAAAATINEWVEDRTNHKIKNVVNPLSLSANTALILVNALYFRGSWLNRFDWVTKNDFFTSATESKKIDFMRQDIFAKYSYDGKLKAKFMELKFEGGNVSMTFVLPDSRTGLAAAEENLQEYLKPRNMERAMIAVALPKFIIETKIDFKPILESLGITNIFSETSDLSGISNTKPLKVDFVLQKAFIDCNEDGVEAAAATTIGVFPPSLPPPAEYKFEADHPFFFYITENSVGATLFAGRFNK